MPNSDYQWGLEAAAKLADHFATDRLSPSEYPPHGMVQASARADWGKAEAMATALAAAIRALIPTQPLSTTGAQNNDHPTTACDVMPGASSGTTISGSRPPARTELDHREDSTEGPQPATRSFSCPLCGSQSPDVYWGKCADYQLRNEPAHVFHWDSTTDADRAKMSESATPPTPQPTILMCSCGSEFKPQCPDCKKLHDGRAGVPVEPAKEK